MSSTSWSSEEEASIVVTFSGGRTWEWPRVQMEAIGYFDRNIFDHRKITLGFYPLEKWYVKEPPPETKQEKRRRLIKEMYPQT